MASPNALSQRGFVRLEGHWEEASPRAGERAPVVGRVGSRAALQFNGSSASLWGNARARPGTSSQPRISYRCTVDGSHRRATILLTSPVQSLSELCWSSELVAGEHVLEFEVEDAVDADVMLEHFTIQEDLRSGSLSPRDLVVVPISVVEVVVVGPDVSTINGTPTTVGWKVVGTTTVIETGTPFLATDTGTGTSTSSAITSSTPPPPPPPTIETQEPSTPPPPAATSQAPTTAEASSPRATPVVQTSDTVPSQSADESSSASLSFVMYTTSSSPEQTSLPGNTTAGSVTAGESKSLAPGAVVGIALGALAILAAAAVVGWIYYLRQKRRQQEARPLMVSSNTAGSLSPYDTPRAFSPDRKLPIVDSVTGTPSSGNSISGGFQGPTLASGSTPLPVDVHAFLREDPMAPLDDSQSTAPPPTYYERPPTYHERQSTLSRPGYF